MIDLTLAGPAFLAGAAAYPAFRLLAHFLPATRGDGDAAPRLSAAEQLRRVFEANPYPMTVSRVRDARFVAVNQGFLRLHGLTEEQVIGRSARELGILVDPAQRQAIAEEAAREGLVQGRDLFVRDGLGRERVLSYSARMVELAGERHLVSVSRDITEERAAAAERERLAAELRQSEERRAAVLRSAPVVQWAIDREGRFTLSEGRGLAQLGLQPGEVVGRSVFDVYRDQQNILRDYQRAARGESFAAINEVGEMVFESRWAPLLDRSGAVVGVTGIAVDVTDRRRVEEQLLHAQKMEAVGRLASGVAHDFNNLLVAILGGCEFLLESERSEPERRQEVESIHAAGLRAAQLVRQLLTFGRKRGTSRETCDLNLRIEEIGALIRRTIGEHVALEFALAPRPLAIVIDPTQLDQILLNLAVNAKDAMPVGGRLRFETRLAQLDAAPGHAAGSWVELTVADTGSGMSPEVRARVFEPFFTTKAPGKGTGLGLSTVFGIVQQCGGQISVASEPGAGTTFRILFQPAAQPSPATSTTSAPSLRARAGAKILVVEDDAPVMRATVRMLEQGGWSVETATTGTEGLERALAGSFDLVLTDLLLPGLLGDQLAAKLREARPGLPVAFVSGDPDSHADRLPEGALLLKKPFSRAELARHLEQALAARNSAPAAAATSL